MYPAWSDRDVDIYGIATLPDGRKVNVHLTGYVEGDTNAFVEEECTFEWEDTGAELTDEEINSEVEHEGCTHFLHEYVTEFAKWENG